MREHRIAASDGVHTFVLDVPAVGPETGPPIVCLHGLTRNHKDFAHLFGHLTQLGRRVIAIDVRGRGKSDRDPNPQNYHPVTYVQDLLGILAFLKVERAVFLGTSMGGLMTLLIAGFAPQMIAGAILNDIGPEIDPAGLKRIQGYVGKPVPPAPNWEIAAQMMMMVGAAAFPGRDLAFWTDFAKRCCVETADGIIFDYDPAIALIANANPNATAPTLWEQFAALSPIPTAVIRGALSDLLSADIVARMKEAKPDLVTAQVSGAGHAPMLDEPEALEAINAIVMMTHASKA
jgi:pimeloyl-ACP methyl ester carboxylesterase